MVELRVLGRGDENALEEFLRRHAESSMLLLSNLRAAGLAEGGGPYHGTYAAAFDGHRIVGVVAHMTRGALLLQAPEALPEVVTFAVAQSRRHIGGFIGPWAQVVAARATLGLTATAARMDSREILYALALRELVVPPMLASGAVRCRRALETDLPQLARWRVAYNVEANRLAKTPTMRRQARDEIERWHADRVLFVLTCDDDRVAYSAFNGAVPDLVQVGGVWTPPALRSRGYARSVVAGSLVMAREEGVERAILFTGEDNTPAQRAYEALGFRPIGDYGLVFFA
jgi:RimJ/RimL family protein N-acetyltransferase